MASLMTQRPIRLSVGEPLSVEQEPSGSVDDLSRTQTPMGPVVFLERYGVWAVSRHDWVEFVLRDYETFSSAAGAGMANLKTEEAWRKPSNILEVDPPVHTTNRRILNRALARPLLRSLQERF